MARKPTQSELNAWKQGYGSMYDYAKKTGGTFNTGMAGVPTTTSANTWRTGTGQAGTRVFPNRADYGSDAEFQRASDAWFRERDTAFQDPTWRADVQRKINRPGNVLVPTPIPPGGGVSIPGYQATPVNPAAGSTLPALPAEMARYYETQLANMRAQERMAMSEQRLGRNQAIADAAAARREALRRAATSGVDVGAALAESGVYSPGLQGVAMDTISAQAAGELGQAAGARSSALEQYLRNINKVLESGRMGRRELDDWRALQIALLNQNQGQQLAGGSPVFGGM